VRESGANPIAKGERLVMITAIEDVIISRIVFIAAHIPPM